MKAGLIEHVLMGKTRCFDSPPLATPGADSFIVSREESGGVAAGGRDTLNARQERDAARDEDRWGPPQKRDGHEVRPQTETKDRHIL